MNRRRSISARGFIPVRTGEIVVSSQKDHHLVAHALGSCIAVILHDSNLGLAGMAHVQCPSSLDASPGSPLPKEAFADIAVSELIGRMERAGAKKNRLRVCLVGGAESGVVGDRFRIGYRNHLAVKRELWKHRVLVDGEQVGGSGWRTVRISVETGQIIVRSAQGEEVL